MKMAAAISPPKSDTWTIATMLGCHGNQGTAAEIATSNDCWEGFDMQDLDWRNDFFAVVAGEIAGRLEAAEEEPGGEEDLVKISLLHHLQGLAHYEIWHYEDSGERFAGIKAIARRHRAAGEPACHDSDYPQAFTEPWVHRIILECVVVAIQRELAAIAAEEALGTAVGGGGDATVLPDVDEYSMMRARALSEAAAGYLNLSGAELDAMGYEPRPFSDAMDEHELMPTPLGPPTHPQPQQPQPQARVQTQVPLKTSSSVKMDVQLQALALDPTPDSMKDIDAAASEATTADAVFVAAAASAKDAPCAT